MKELTGRHVLFALLGFFGVIMAVNAVMVGVALQSWTGLVETQSYRKGLDYNDSLDRERAQGALGWRSTVALAPDEAAAAGTYRLSLRLSGADGAAIAGRTVAVTLSRPVGEYPPVTAELREGEAGTYSTALNLPMPGNWQAEFTIAREPRDYLVRARLWAR